jgi:hypothetical protein
MAEFRSYAPGWIEETNDVVGEGTVDWIHDSKLSQRLHDHEQHDTDDHEANDLFHQGQTSNHCRHGRRLTREPGPPLRRALPEPTKRPAPMAPPGRSRQNALTGGNGMETYRSRSSACVGHEGYA